jgi:hypothetical protein
MELPDKPAEIGAAKYKVDQAVEIHIEGYPVSCTVLSVDHILLAGGTDVEYALQIDPAQADYWLVNNIQTHREADISLPSEK